MTLVFIPSSTSGAFYAKFLSYFSFLLFLIHNLYSIYVNALLCSNYSYNADEKPMLLYSFLYQAIYLKIIFYVNVLKAIYANKDDPGLKTPSYCFILHGKVDVLCLKVNSIFLFLLFSRLFD